MKIVVVSLIANSADIVESFVRHSLTFADEMIIVEHLSTDGTQQILDQLQKEGLPLCIRSCETAELKHGEIMTELVHEAIKNNGADIVLPLDADEFLICDNGKTCRQALEVLPTDSLYELKNTEYRFINPEENKNLYTLSRRCSKTDIGSPKIFVGKGFADKHPEMRIVQGAHYAFDGFDSAEHRLSVKKLDNIMHLAHFQWRSKSQVMAKGIEGWISNVARYSRQTDRCAYWGDFFHRILRGESFEQIDKAMDTEAADLSQYENEAVLCYTEVEKDELLLRLMNITEQLAEDYAEEKVKNSGAKVSVVLPHWGNKENVRFSADSIVKQGVSRLELVICGEIDDLNEFLDYDSDFPDSWELKLIEWNGAAGELPIGEDIGNNVTGDYISWLFPGIAMKPDMLKKMLAALVLDTRYSFALTDYEMTDNDGVIRLNELIDESRGAVAAFEAKKLGEGLLSLAKTPSGGIPGALFRREQLQKLNWFLKLADMPENENLTELNIWQCILKYADTVAVFKEALLAGKA